MNRIYKYKKYSFMDKLWDFIHIKTNIGMNFIKIKWLIKYGTCDPSKIYKIGMKKWQK